MANTPDLSGSTSTSRNGQDDSRNIGPELITPAVHGDILNWLGRVLNDPQGVGASDQAEARAAEDPTSTQWHAIPNFDRRAGRTELIREDYHEDDCSSGSSDVAGSFADGSVAVTTSSETTLADYSSLGDAAGRQVPDDAATEGDVSTACSRSDLYDYAYESSSDEGWQPERRPPPSPMPQTVKQWFKFLGDDYGRLYSHNGSPPGELDWEQVYELFDFSSPHIIDLQTPTFEQYVAILPDPLTTRPLDVKVHFTRIGMHIDGHVRMASRTGAATRRMACFMRSWCRENSGSLTYSTHDNGKTTGADESALIVATCIRFIRGINIAMMIYCRILATCNAHESAQNQDNAHKAAGAPTVVP